MTNPAPSDDAPSESIDADERSESVDAEDPGWPWSFILLVVAGAIYLAFRFVELFLNLLT